jgi:hypothetical protein
MGGKLGTVGCGSGRKKEIKNNLNFIKKNIHGIWAYCRRESSGVAMLAAALRRRHLFIYGLVLELSPIRRRLEIVDTVGGGKLAAVRMR